MAEKDRASKKKDQLRITLAVAAVIFGIGFLGTKQAKIKEENREARAAEQNDSMLQAKATSVGQMALKRYNAGEGGIELPDKRVKGAVDIFFFSHDKKFNYGMLVTMKPGANGQPDPTTTFSVGVEKFLPKTNIAIEKSAILTTDVGTSSGLYTYDKQYSLKYPHKQIKATDSRQFNSTDLTTKLAELTQVEAEITMKLPQAATGLPPIEPTTPA